MGLPRKDGDPVLEDRLIILATIRGDRKAALALYDRYREQVWRVVARMVSDPEITMEICQETWLRAFSSLDRFRSDSRFSTWILWIATNLVNSRGRWSRIRKHISLEAASEKGIKILPERPPTQVHSVVRKRENLAIQEALLGLPRKQRQAVILRIFEELSYSEVAAIMGCKETSVRTHLKRAYQSLGRALEKQIDVEGRTK
jgi:RNA polymerase sigma-70 factor (ECF subfamily)